MGKLTKNDYRKLQIKNEKIAKEILQEIKDYDVDKNGFDKLKALTIQLNSRIEIIEAFKKEQK